MTKTIELNSSSSVVLDTNVVISGGITPSGTNYKIVQMCIAGRFKGIISEELLAEYVEVMSRKKFVRYGFPPEWFEKFKKVLNLVPKPVRSPLRAVQEQDQMLVDLAHAFSAILVTGNMKHFPDEVRQKVTCLAPVEFLEICEGKEETVDVEKKGDAEKKAAWKATLEERSASLHKTRLPARQKAKICGAPTQKNGFCQRRGNCPNHK